MKHIGFTGTQAGMKVIQRHRVLELLATAVDEGPAALHLGDCYGADAEAYGCARKWKLRTIGHPPTDPKKRAFLTYDEERAQKPYLERNHDIVDESEFLIAVPRQSVEQLRSGTWATVRYAVRVGKRVLIVRPDGRVEIR